FIREEGHGRAALGQRLQLSEDAPRLIHRRGVQAALGEVGARLSPELAEPASGLGEREPIEARQKHLDGDEHLLAVALAEVSKDVLVRLGEVEAQGEIGDGVPAVLPLIEHREERRVLGLRQVGEDSVRQPREQRPSARELRLVEAVDDERLEDLAVADRKSTRLNSSHVKISYAVFCLKKKNNSYN